jgi:hypothetical protein
MQKIVNNFFGKFVAFALLAVIFFPMVAMGARTFSLPSQKNQAGKFLQTDGSNVSWATAGAGGGVVETVTGLNTDNTDPQNPIVQISVDSTLAGAGTPGSPLSLDVGAVVGDDVVGGTADHVLYIDNSGNLFGDADFTRDSTTFTSRLADTSGADTGELAVSSTQVGLTFNDSTNIYGIQADTNSLDLRSGLLTWLWPSTDGTASVATPLMSDGAGGLTFAKPVQYDSTNDRVIFGSEADPLTDFYLGEGLTSTSLGDVSIHATPRTGTNVIGARMIIAGGLGTGNAVSGGVRLSVPVPTGSGTTAQGLQQALDIDGNRNIRAYGLHNNATANGSASNQDIRSGTYTPTCTAGSNFDAFTCNTFQWLRVGNVVTVSGTITVDATTASASTTGRFDLPVASNLAVTADLSGTTGTTSNEAGLVIADTVNDAVSLSYRAVGTASQTMSIHFTYEVL